MAAVEVEVMVKWFEDIAELELAYYLKILENISGVMIFYRPMEFLQSHLLEVQ